MLKYVVAAAGGVVAGIVIYKLIEHYRNNQKTEKARILEQCFGEPMLASTFSMREVRDWIKAREDKLKGGSKAAVLKVNETTLKSFGKDLDIGDGLENNIVIAIVNSTTKEIEESVLVKYEKLDANLEMALDRGNGVLVVEA